MIETQLGIHAQQGIREIERMTQWAMALPNRENNSEQVTTLIQRTDNGDEKMGDAISSGDAAPESD